MTVIYRVVFQNKNLNVVEKTTILSYALNMSVVSTRIGILADLKAYGISNFAPAY